MILTLVVRGGSGAAVDDGGDDADAAAAETVLVGDEYGKMDRCTLLSWSSYCNKI